MINEHPRCAPKGAFTIIEMLVVIAIIGILAGLVLGMAGTAARKAADAHVRTLLQKVKLGIEEYRTEYNVYPQVAAEDLYAVLVDDIPLGKRPFLELKSDEVARRGAKLYVVDPWGTPLHYNVDVNDPDIHNPDSYDLASWGPDGEEGGGDDITNW